MSEKGDYYRSVIAGNTQSMREFYQANDMENIALITSLEETWGDQRNNNQMIAKEVREKMEDDQRRRNY